MSLPPIPLSEPSHLKSFCSLRNDPDCGHPFDTLEELSQRVNQIFEKPHLCHHDVEDFMVAYKKIERIEPDMPLKLLKELPSKMIMQRVQEQIKSILSASENDARAPELINLYHLTHLLPIAPSTSQEESIASRILRQRKEKGGDFQAESIALQLLYCARSRDHFQQDVQELTGLDQNDLFIQKLAKRPLKLSALDKELRKRRRAFLDQGGAKDYPRYLDLVLEHGFLHLYRYLLDIAEKNDRGIYRKKIKHLNAFKLSCVVLDVRNAIVEQVRRSIRGNQRNVVFLVGNTGSGKSTAFCLLKGESLQRKGDFYEVSGQTIISHDINISHTLLPNVSQDENNVYIDFPGFSDTRGEPINLGIELAFKVLVTLYKPKIVIVESISASEGSRGELVRSLGIQIERMLGATAKEALCSLFLTRYLQLPQLDQLKLAEADKQRREEKVEKLRKDIRQKRAFIDWARQQIESTVEPDPEKEEEYKREIDKLKQELKELEQEKIQGLSDIYYKRLRSSYEEDLLKKENALQQLLQGETSPAERERLIEEIKNAKEKIELEGKRISKNSEKIAESKALMEQAKKDLAEKAQLLTRLLGIIPAPNKIAELRELENPETLATCKEVIKRAQPIDNACYQLSSEYHLVLLDSFTRTFARREIPPPPNVEFNILQQRVLETSLIGVLTSESYPEIREFLHLPEMDPGFAERVDQEIVKVFAEMLIRLIFISSVQGDGREDIIEEFIDKQIGGHGGRSELQAKWTALKKEASDISKSGARNWEELRKYYRERFETDLDDIKEGKKKYLKEWDEWAANLFGFKYIGGVPRLLYMPKIKQGANKEMIKALGEMIDRLKDLLDRIKDFQKLIANKGRVETYWRKCKNAVEAHDLFVETTQQSVQEISEIYDESSIGDETWERRIEKIKGRAISNTPNFWSAVCTTPLLMELMKIGLCCHGCSSREFTSRAAEYWQKEGRKTMELGEIELMNIRLEEALNESSDHTLASKPKLESQEKKEYFGLLSLLKEVLEVRVSTRQGARRKEAPAIATKSHRRGERSALDLAEKEIQLQVEKYLSTNRSEDARKKQSEEILSALGIAKKIRRAEMLLTETGSLPCSSLMTTLQVINETFAQRVGLDLGITFHRALLLDLLDESGPTGGSWQTTG